MDADVDADAEVEGPEEDAAAAADAEASSAVEGFIRSLSPRGFRRVGLGFG